MKVEDLRWHGNVMNSRMQTNNFNKNRNALRSRKDLTNGKKNKTLTDTVLQSSADISIM